MTGAEFRRPSRGRVSGLAIVGAALVVAVLSSCTSGAALTLSASSVPLKEEIAKLAADYQKSKGFRISLADVHSAPRGTVISIGWSFFTVKNDAKVAPLSNEKLLASGFRTALAFEQWARTEAGWREVPLLWDAWGIAFSPNEIALLPIGATFTEKDRALLLKARQGLLTPGGESGVRQSLFWFANTELPGDAALRGMLLGGVERSTPSSLLYFKSLAALSKDPVFSPGSFTMMKPDVENLARTAGVGPLFGSYQWLRSVQGAGRRDNRPLVYPQGLGYAMPVSILCGRVTGTGSSADRARDFLIWLLSGENQKILSTTSGYMAANFNAADLDLNSKGARDAAIGAARIVPIQPEPTEGSAAESWGSLLGRILARPADWERVLAERVGP